MAAPVSIVVPNYNGLELMELNLAGVRATLEGYEPGGELIVVDDGSSDGSRAWLENQGVKVLAHDRNRGFQAACTTGIEAATSTYVILLNTDVEVNSDFITPLVEAIEPEQVFAAGSLALEEDGVTVGENVKLPYLASGKLKFRKFKRLNLEECRSHLTAPAPTLFVTGGFMALRRSLFFELGGFDPLFEPFYYEDADLCYRAWKRGYEVLLQPASVVVHRHRGSILTHHRERRVRRIQERNRLLLLWKNLTSSKLFVGRHLVPLIARSLVKWLVLDLDFYRALFGALRRLGPAREARAREKREATRCDEEVFHSIIHAQNSSNTMGN